MEGGLESLEAGFIFKAFTIETNFFEEDFLLVFFALREGAAMFSWDFKRPPKWLLLGE